MKIFNAGPSNTLTADIKINIIQIFSIIPITMKVLTTGYEIRSLLNITFVSDFTSNLVFNSIFTGKRGILIPAKIGFIKTEVL